MEVTTQPSMVTFITMVMQLKVRFRRGWLSSGISEVDCEKVSCHSWGLSLLSFFFIEDKTLDAKRMAQMAIVHDLAEAIVGDITPSDSIPKAQKKLLELDAMKKICSACPDKSVAELILNLFEEYETDETKESQICHDLDKLEMLFTAYSYERGLRCQNERKALNLQTTPLQNEQEHARADAIDLNEFFLSCRGKIRDERCQQWYLEILQARTGATQLDEP